MGDTGTEGTFWEACGLRVEGFEIVQPMLQSFACLSVATIGVDDDDDDDDGDSDDEDDDDEPLLAARCRPA